LLGNRTAHSEYLQHQTHHVCVRVGQIDEMALFAVVHLTSIADVLVGLAGGAQLNSVNPKGALDHRMIATVGAAAAKCYNELARSSCIQVCGPTTRSIGRAATRNVEDKPGRCAVSGACNLSGEFGDLFDLDEAAHRDFGFHVTNVLFGHLGE
jgi:hypothetical protein